MSLFVRVYQDTPPSNSVRRLFVDPLVECSRGEDLESNITPPPELWMDITKAFMEYRDRLQKGDKTKCFERADDYTEEEGRHVQSCVALLRHQRWSLWPAGLAYVYPNHLLSALD